MEVEDINDIIDGRVPFHVCHRGVFRTECTLCSMFVGQLCHRPRTSLVRLLFGHDFCIGESLLPQN